MNKKIIISFDDLWESNDHWNCFEKLYQEFPNLKITFFVITGKCSEKFLRKIKQPWCELVFHGTEHSGGWRHWSEEETTKYLKKFNENYDFVDGFKAPAYKWTNDIINACNELNFWMCSSPTVRVKAKRHWYTYPRDGLSFYDDYVEYYDHLQNKNFLENLNTLKDFCRKEKPKFEFISENIIYNA